MTFPTSHLSAIRAAATESSSGSSWGAVASLGIAAFALVSTEFLPVGLLPQIAHELGQSEGQTGLMVTLPSVMGAFAAPLTIAFAGRLDRRRLLGGLVALLALSNFVVAMSGAFAAVLFGRLLMGIAVGGFWTIGGSLGPRLKPGSQAARASALILSGVSIGTVAGVPAGALLGALVGWRWAFAAAGVISLVVLALLLVLLPGLPSTATRNGLREIPTLLRAPKVRLGLATILLLFGGQFSAYTYISPFLLQAIGIAPAALGAVLLGYGASGFVGNLIGGWLAERSAHGALVATGLVQGISVLGLVLLGQGDVAWSVALVIFWGLGFGMLPIAVQSWMFGAAPQRLEAVQAMFVSAAQAAIGGGALLGGVLADSLGTRSAMWLGALSALMLSLVVVCDRFMRQNVSRRCCAQAL